MPSHRCSLLEKLKSVKVQSHTRSARLPSPPPLSGGVQLMKSRDIGDISDNIII